MLLSFINMKLRDVYPSMDDLVEDLDVSREEIDRTLKTIDYEYDRSMNRYV